jgi:hypothetical protein
MVKFEDVWRDQCDATATILSRYGERAALDYLVGEKLLHFVSATKGQPEFAAQLPSFVGRVRQMFPREVMLTYLTELEARLTEESHEVDMDDLSLRSSAISDLTSLKQVADLLRVEKLGTA